MAPAATSAYVKQYVDFYGTGETLGMRGKLALFDVSTSGNVGTFNGLVGGGSAIGVSACRLSPTSPTTTTTAVAYSSAVGFISPALDLLGSAFTRYKQKKAVFHYLPLFTTNSTQQLIFGFAADPCHPQLSASTATAPTFSGIESLSDSRPFAPWCEWKMDVSSKLTKEWLYLSSNSGDTTAGSDTARFDNWGSIACVVATAGTATAERYGVLYLEFDMEFKEFCPISVTRPSLLRALADKLNYHYEKHLARTAQGLSMENSQTSPGSDVLKCSSSSTLLPPSSKPNYKELDLDGFLLRFQARRRDGETPGQIVTDLSESYILDARCIKLIFESGLLDYLSHPGCRHETESTDGCPEPEEYVPQIGHMTLADVKKPSVSNFKIGLE